MSFWGVIEAVVGLFERVVNRPKPEVAPAKDVAQKALEKWQRDRPQR
jgi:hypothetical protein